MPALGRREPRHELAGELLDVLVDAVAPFDVAGQLVELQQAELGGGGPALLESGGVGADVELVVHVEIVAGQFDRELFGGALDLQVDQQPHNFAIAHRVGDRVVGQQLFGQLRDVAGAQRAVDQRELNHAEQVAALVVG